MSDEKSEFEFNPIDLMDLSNEPPQVPVVRDIDVPESINKETDRNVDYERVRENYYNLVEKGQQALDELLNVAQNSEHPRAYEVVATLIKSLSDTNEKILETHEAVEKIKKQQLENEGLEENGPQPGKVTNNAIFVGTMSEFQKMIKQASGEDYSEEGEKVVS